MRRFWFYKWDAWKVPPDWPWYARFLPSLGGDEYDRQTVVLPIPFVGQLVVALWAGKEPS